MNRARGQTAQAAPPSHFLYGHRRAYWQQPLQFLQQCAREYGDVVPLRLRHTTFLISHPDDIQHVLVHHCLNYQKTEIVRRFHRFLGGGLLSSESPRHGQQRRLLQPLLHRKMVGRFADTIHATAVRRVEEWVDDRDLDASKELVQLAWDVSAEIMLGLDRCERQQQIFTDLNGSAQRVMRKMRAIFDLPEYIPTRTNRSYRKFVARLDKVVYSLIESCREQRNSSSCLLRELLQVQRQRGERFMSDRQIRDHLLTMLLAGSGTVDITLRWSCYHLARNAEVQQRVRDELNTVCHNRVLSPSDVSGLKYLQRFLSEVLRLYPPVWRITRCAAQDDVLPSGTRVSAGSDIFICPYIVQRDPRYFSEPGRFDPDRFLPEHVRERAGGTYFPFGIGPRACVGEPLGKLEAMLILSTIVSRFELSSADREPVEPESFSGFGLEPSRPILIRVRQRTTDNCNAVLPDAA